MKKRFSFFLCAIMAILLLGKTAFSEPPTAQDDAGVAGTWHVSGTDFDRRYDITSGRNIKIVGSGFKERRGRLIPQENGSYLVNLDGNQVLKLVYTRVNDHLSVELFTKKNLELGLPPAWKAAAVRKQP